MPFFTADFTASLSPKLMLTPELVAFAQPLMLTPELVAFAQPLMLTPELQHRRTHSKVSIGAQRRRRELRGGFRRVLYVSNFLSYLGAFSAALSG